MQQPITITHPTDKANFCRIALPHIEIWFSYEDPIAFRTYASISRNSNLVVRKNDWGATTAKHLDFIDSKKITRIAGAEFEVQLNEALSKDWELIRVKAQEALRSLE